ncbi:unnamed protein product [Alopecurus aequalis]
MRFWATEALGVRAPEDGESDAGKELGPGAAPEQRSGVAAKNKGGSELAIKLVGGGVGGGRGFSAEVGTLGRIRHHNIFRLLGFVSNRIIVRLSMRQFRSWTP